MNSLFYIIIYFVVVNIFGFALMGIDKRRARKSAFRIPEATLFSVAIIGGSLGSTIGMFFFKHKTKHWYFKFGLPLIFLIQIVIIVVLFFLPLEIRFI
ncbi:Uncharacterized membrane protein YsdA, DUF1294 family [Butyrivibrio hungatei DSM 14810]|uniref:DUF1294 domain-containing protein n=2 Tax=Butyrivibrio hungatei TaxID=185008 RepID=A0A1D9P2H5_9FIRM|nr:DUF1294 domain-containing protein [Butyrivibrio hungatei]AOZ96692.1 hypothetical protein bhn_I1659 [Butyrivibrio hungatei]SHN55395.1 Uncharacterized membrane protein YsdA, DUF1294 family [Butyrivibrio hungatei DSM 14810]